MKKTIMILAIVLTSLTVFGQNITGDWNGRFHLKGKDLKVVFHISKTRSGFKSTMDSPDQKEFRMPVTFTSFNDSILTLEIVNAGIEYLGTIDKDNNFVGAMNLKQSNQLCPLILSKKEID